MVMLDAKQLEESLAKFQDTEEYFKNALGFYYTDGIKFLADNADCHWLIDAIGNYQRIALKSRKLRYFQLWMLVVRDSHEFIKPKPGNDAVLTCWKDTPNQKKKPAIAHQIPCTNFPLPFIKLYLENKVLMLPSER